MLVVTHGTPGTVYRTTITINQGETVGIVMQICQADGVTPLNITGASLKAAIAFPSPLGTVEFSTNQGQGITITDALLGMVEWDMASALTADYPIGAGVPFDFWLVLGADEYPLIQGPFVVLSTVTPVP